jgi:MoaA/NifB/PqqE/SkfB family radical SAM enzyme/glycosyltransferase involved in cell wall biosynthesis
VRVAVLTRGDLFPAHHGAAVKIVRTAEGLVAAGDSVVVVTDDRDHYWHVTTSGWEKVPYGARFRAFEEWPVLRNGARAERWCRRVGYPAEEVFLYRPIFDPAWWARALWVGRAERIEAWHAEFPGYAAPAALAARLTGGRSVAVMHNVEFDRLRQTTELPERVIRRLAAVEVALLRAVDDVVAVSEPDRERIVEAGVTRGRVHVVPHGVDFGSYGVRPVDLRARYGIGEGPILYFHGTLHYGPNAEALRFIARELVPRLPRGVVVVSGMTPPRELEGPRLRFTGPVDDLAAHIEAADLCICPLFAGGGTRMKLLEYFAAGKAVVSTPLGAEGLDVADGVQLALAEKDEFVATVLRVLSDPAARRRMGHAAREYARARDWSAIAEATRRIHRGEGADFVPRPSVEAHLPPRRPSKPLTLLLLVNRGCNLRCRFCDLWEGKIRMPLDRATALFAEAAKIGTKTVVITGGEPLLHPELPAIVRAAKARGMGVNITTNGTILDRHYDTLVAAGVDSLSMSIDGLPETHDRLRGQDGAHARTWKALERVVREGKVGANVYFVVTRENVRELVTVWEQVRALGAGFDFWPVNDAPDLTLTRPEDRAAWEEAVATIARADADVAARAHYYREALRYHAGEKAAMRCLGLVDQYGVTYDGDLLPCCVWGAPGLKVGNVFETPLSTLWTSPEVQRHREALFGQGCDAGCYNHSLYEFTVSTGLSHRVERPDRAEIEGD